MEEYEKLVQKNKFKISGTTWDQEYKCRIAEITDKLPAQIYVNKIQIKFTLCIKFGYYLDFLTPEANGENIPQGETIEVILVQCNTVNNQYQHN